MKIEVGSFTPSASPTIFLNDSSLVIRGIHFMISKNGSTNNLGHGFSDGTRNRANWTLRDTVVDSGRNTSNCVYNKKLSGGSAVVANAGAVSSIATAGEFSMAFSTVDNSYSVDFMVIGD